MGSTWSLNFAQDANLDRLRSIPSLGGAHPLSDRGSPSIVARPSGGAVKNTDAKKTRCYVYVDILGIASLNRKVKIFLIQLGYQFTNYGLMKVVDPL